MSKLHLDYSEYKTLIGDYGVTPWTKYNWLSGPESPFFGGFKRVYLSDIEWTYDSQYNRFKSVGIFNDWFRTRTGQGARDGIGYSNKYIMIDDERASDFTADDWIYSGTTLAGDTSIYVQEHRTTNPVEFKQLAKGAYLTYKVIPTYTRLAYIQSTGTQWIDTGVYATLDTSVFVDTIPTALSTAATDIFGSYEGANAAFDVFYYAAQGGKVEFGYGNSRLPLGPVLTANTRYKFSIDHGIATVNDTVWTIQNTATSMNQAHTQLLFQMNSVNGVRSAPSPQKLYSCKYWDNGVLIRDFIPARRNSDNVVGLYDTVTGQFYTNGGTGSFIAGEIL